MEAVNTHLVYDWLWTSGQLSASDIATLASLGIDAVINLALPTSSNALAGEAELVTTHGIAYIQIPVEWEQPTVEQFEYFVGVLDAFAGKRIWVHCAMNMRVSTFVYLYRRLVRGEPESEARFPMRTVWEPNEVWRKYIADVTAHYEARNDA